MTRSKETRRRSPRIWVVLHCEVALTLDAWSVDEDVSFTASSRQAAERLIRLIHVDPGSWWRVECARLDDIEGTRAEDRLGTTYYSRSGKVIPSPPRVQGYRAAILREKRNVRRIQDRLKTAARDGLSKQVLRNLRSCLRSLKQVLSRHK